MFCYLEHMTKLTHRKVIFQHALASLLVAEAYLESVDEDCKARYHAPEFIAKLMGNGGSFDESVFVFVNYSLAMSSAFKAYFECFELAGLAEEFGKYAETPKNSEKAFEYAVDDLLGFSSRMSFGDEIEAVDTPFDGEMPEDFKAFLSSLGREEELEEYDIYDDDMDDLDDLDDEDDDDDELDDEEITAFPSMPGSEHLISDLSEKDAHDLADLIIQFMFDRGMFEESPEPAAPVDRVFHGDFDEGETDEDEETDPDLMALDVLIKSMK